MTAIEEKARDFASEFSSQRSLIYGFEKGAEWMLAKATEYIQDRMIEAMAPCIKQVLEDFVKAMEE